MALNYQKVERKQFAQSVRKITTENKYWNTFRPSYEDKLHLNIPFLRFCGNDPYNCIVCSNYDVRIFRNNNFASYKKLNFKNKPLVADMRSDRKLLAVGGKNGLFRIYNSNNNNININAIRVLYGHYNDINELKFDPLNTSKIISFSSDKTCGYWDIINSKQILSIKNSHLDFIKSGDWIYNNNNLIISGSYDHLCKLWDLRTEYSVSIPKSVSVFDHKFPIESCISIPNTDLIAAGGGANISIWSIRKTNKPLNVISKLHRKTITCLAVNKLGTRLLSGCLDNFVRVFKINNNESSYKNVHSFITQSSILSVDIDNNDTNIAIGTLNNGIIIRKRQEIIVEHSIDNRSKLDDIHYGTKDWFIRGQKMKMGDIGDNIQSYNSNKKFKLKKYDIALSQFRYRDALNYALLTGDTLTVYNVLEDLWRRNGLEIALGGRDNNGLIPILEYLIYSLPHPHLTQVSLHVSAVIIDQYVNIIGLDNDIDKLFKMIYKIINDVIKRYKILIKLQGNIQMILSAQDIIANPLSQKLINLASKINKQIDNKVDSLNMT